MWTTLTFTRRENGKITTIAIVEVQTGPTLYAYEVFKRLKLAVTDWVNENQEGQRAYHESVDDFNIGDLANWENSIQGSLLPFLQRHGILDVRFKALADPEASFDYDTLLVDESRLSRETLLALEE